MKYLAVWCLSVSTKSEPFRQQTRDWAQAMNASVSLFGAFVGLQAELSTLKPGGIQVSFTKCFVSNKCSVNAEQQ